MKNPTRWRALLCLASLLAVAGCSNGNDNMMATVDPAQAAAAVGAAMNAVAVPLVAAVQGLSLVLPLERGVAACDEPVGCPFGGTIQLCPTSIVADMCDVGVSIDGSIDNINLLAGTGFFNLTIDGTLFRGPGFVGDGGCKGSGGLLILDNVSARFDGITASLDSNLQICDGVPAGTITITTDLLRIVLSGDGAGTITGVATDLSSGQIIVTCTGSLGQSPIDPACS